MENLKETSSNVVEFLQKNKAAFAVAAGAALAFGVVGYVWRKRARATAAVDEHGYSLDPKFDNNVALYKEEAIKRKKILSNVSYDLVLAVRKSEFFEGHVVIIFDVSEEDFHEKDLFIDYHGLGIKGLKINDTEVDSGHAFNGQRIHVAKAHLKLGARNTVSVTFKSKYRNDGTGFHHFVDNEDNNEYVYTQFEAFNAHRAFPCFDQPDLRAELSLKTLAPKDWIVLSNGLERDILTKGDEKFDEAFKGIAQEFADRYTDGFNLQLYSTTPAIATYLYAFIAGPFEFIETNEMIPGRKDPLRMRLYCRKTLKKDMERIQKYMFEPVVLAINWYSEFFGYNYPYEKYDQIFCPEFKFGAMENVGCVTFTERLLFRGKEMTERDITSLINVALHELCHHWFGDLVTMTWWNDLWLNESFATYVSFLCMASVKTLFKQCPNLWVNVNSYKNWGYAEDDLSTGHPICKQAPHTDSADDMINGITYGKGCSFLKQLFHLIGYDTFSRATQIYFEKYQWKNTVLKNFLE
mmetsp:Transcript_19163/g.22123  ORF Transcript_19163/g.22123 Transcript_19163/m.22123 type:complete len:523 (+) Transcript_19163:21-1589(+)